MCLHSFCRPSPPLSPRSPPLLATRPAPPPLKDDIYAPFDSFADLFGEGGYGYGNSASSFAAGGHISHYDDALPASAHTFAIAAPEGGCVPSPGGAAVEAACVTAACADALLAASSVACRFLFHAAAGGEAEDALSADSAGAIAAAAGGAAAVRCAFPAAPPGRPYAEVFVVADRRLLGNSSAPLRVLEVNASGAVAPLSAPRQGLTTVRAGLALRWAGDGAFPRDACAPAPACAFGDAATVPAELAVDDATGVATLACDAPESPTRRLDALQLALDSADAGAFFPSGADFLLGNGSATVATVAAELALAGPAASTVDAEDAAAIADALADELGISRAQVSVTGVEFSVAMAVRLDGLGAWSAAVEAGVVAALAAVAGVAADAVSVTGVTGLASSPGRRLLARLLLQDGGATPVEVDFAVRAPSAAAAAEAGALTSAATSGGALAAALATEGVAANTTLTRDPETGAVVTLEVRQLVEGGADGATALAAQLEVAAGAGSAFASAVAVLTGLQADVAATAAEVDLDATALYTAVCPAGYRCAHPDATSVVACPAGYYSPAGSDVCTWCPPGASCALARSQPAPCAAGFYALGGATECTPCPEGSMCPSASQAPTPCLPGTVSHIASRTCSPCPAGFSCPTATYYDIVACAAGTTSAPGAVACSACPAGKRCPDAADAALQPACAPGTYSTGGAAEECEGCPAGWECPSATGEANRPCAVGFYSLGGAVALCQPCPAGHACESAAALPVPCTNGTVSLAGQAACSPCPTGRACPNPDGTGQTACGAGTYATGGATACSPCPAGFSCADPTSAAATPCGEGTYSLGGQSVCHACPAGHTCDDPASLPVRCGVGEYALAGGASSCALCPAGFMCPEPWIEPQPCPLGSFSSGGAQFCSECADGFACSNHSSVATPAGQECGCGYHCANGRQYECPAGTYGVMRGATTAAEGCAECPAGYSCAAASCGAPSDGSLCPAGHYCPSGTQFPTQFPCDGGTFNAILGATEYTACQLCHAGHYCPRGTADPLVVPAGHFGPVGTAGAHDHPCPSGTYSGAVTGLSDLGGCKPCGPGAHCPEGSVSPTLCPAGTFNADFGGGFEASCRRCRPGRACSARGLTEPNEPCGAGHYCPEGTTLPTEHACPPGTMSTSTNLTRAADCDACPAGFACGWATGSMSAAPVRCAAGFFCPEGTELPTQHPCPEGTYSNVTGLRAASEVSFMLRTTAPTHTRAQRAQRAQRSHLSLSLSLSLAPLPLLLFLAIVGCSALPIVFLVVLSGSLCDPDPVGVPAPEPFRCERNAKAESVLPLSLSR